MPDKGFEIKVLVPTENGTSVSLKSLNDVPYYLLYNVSNRSYQLAGKIKVAELMSNGEFSGILKQLITEHGINLILSNRQELNLGIKYRTPENIDIGDELNSMIDLIDKKKELI